VSNAIYSWWFHRVFIVSIDEKYFLIRKYYPMKE